ncbi:thioredoxin fold domain-containing protein [Carboxylicivirga sp. A043]|uniref:thioredoxin family protein n=1 Tax=Carboxylicivirga litoralis TaxID=2816963 RepID=UPI0021CB50FF|nr:thioredoxin family protein [Carboxylicivirga sp. A043]MCU4158295.1 thioredoxin fold domain-containing protein [Carboxylicivirga sp. A043]
MKIFYLIFATLFISLSTMGQGINFEDITVEDAVIKAKEENKYVFIDVYTDWCSPCKLMAQKVFPLKELGDYFNKKFVNIKVNAQSGVAGPKFAIKYKVSAYPTFIILDNNGELVHMFAGGVLDGEKFIHKVKEAFNPSKAFGQLKKRYEDGERDPKLVSGYIQALMASKSIKQNGLNDMVNEFYNSLSDKGKISSEAFFIFENYAKLGSDREKFLEENKKKFRKVVGTEKVDSVFIDKYALYFGMIVKVNRKDVSVEDINNTWEKVNSLGITNLKTLPVFKSAAIIKTSKSGKEELFSEIEKTIPNLTDNEKDLMLYIVIPGLKDLLTKEEKDKLLALVSSDSVKGYIINSTYR